MGRGRAKAKQTKVARALKYGGPDTDLDRLQAELSGSGSSHVETVDDDTDEDYGDDYDDPYAKYLDDGDDSDDAQDGSRTRAR